MRLEIAVMPESEVNRPRASALFFVFGVIYVVRHPETAHFSGTAFFNPSKFDMGAMMSAVSLCALSYVGFGSIVTLDDECVQPKKGPGKAMIIIVLILGFLYMSMSFLTMCMDPSGNIMIANQNSGFYAVAGLAGKWLGVLCAVANALALGLFTSLSGMTAISGDERKEHHTPHPYRHSRQVLVQRVGGRSPRSRLSPRWPPSRTACRPSRT